MVPPASRVDSCQQWIADPVGLDHPDAIIGKTDFDLTSTEEEAKLFRVGDRRVIAGELARADIAIVPCPVESFGLVAVESQACGTPVIAAAVRTATSIARAALRAREAR